MGRKQYKNKIFITVLILLAALILIVLGVKFIGTSRLETVLYEHELGRLLREYRGFMFRK